MGERLKGKVAVITGGGRGIGRGVALRMGGEGARVVVNDLGGNLDGSGASTSAADDVVKEIRAAGGTAVSSYDSVASMEGGQKIIKTALDAFGRVDIVATPAGIIRDRMIFNMSEDEWNAVIAVHLKGTFAVVRAACPVMRDQRSGCILTFSSSAGLNGNIGQANYGSAKGALAALATAVARDMAPYGVRANSISPSALTRMTAGLVGGPADRQAAAQAAVVEEGPPVVVPRMDPDDVAPFAVWLASDAGAYISGCVFSVAGGRVSLVEGPRPLRTMIPDKNWTVEGVAAEFPRTLGLGLANPKLARESPGK